METDPALPALHILYEKALPRYDSLETICRALSTSAQRGCIELKEVHACLTRYPPHQKRSEELVPGNPQVRALSRHLRVHLRLRAIRRPLHRICGSTTVTLFASASY